MQNQPFNSDILLWREYIIRGNRSRRKRYARTSHSVLPEKRIVRIEINRIAPSPFQPRREADADAIRQLAESIRQYGLLSPVLVRRVNGSGYELIAGERRLRAMALLGWSHTDAIVTAARDRDSALIGLIENLQREDLHFLDEAEACRRILREQGISQEELAAALGKSPSALANLLRLLRLGKPVQRAVRDGGLSERHARALLRANGESEQLRLAQLAARDKYSVRELEAQIERQRKAAKPAHPSPAAGLIRDSRLVINALRDTVRQLKRIGVPASSRMASDELVRNI